MLFYRKPWGAQATASRIQTKQPLCLIVFVAFQTTTYFPATLTAARRPIGAVTIFIGPIPQTANKKVGVFL